MIRQHTTLRAVVAVAAILVMPPPPLSDPLPPEPGPSVLRDLVPRTSTLAALTVGIPDQDTGGGAPFAAIT
ncbi:hypothetical protein GCM10011505_05070 [Tistrella bauzanensis]|uniref:Uncharacterized protein n=1 Tax=Tistrella bauzanensis TaxID=657419 RepID=A0ABQ1IAB7_9PROT|nr:hypothetical protein [Tistrella bauzanensis]GGB26727.1 hypothetical protein GCM10011505_05070 [Tistrella bauzanensis]